MNFNVFVTSNLSTFQPFRAFLDHLLDENVKVV